jgi:glutamate/tyrosine decarboxylase-like PLP-dependent enzyme
VDGNGAMRADALAAALREGGGPTIVCAQAGNVNTGAVDPLEAVVAAGREHGAWVHVDGAFGLWAAASPRLASLVRGHAGADSWAVDAHKWLNVPYDCALAIVADPLAHQAALGVSAPYLSGGAERNAVSFVPELSRRARGVPVYAALRQLGRQGVAALVERCCSHARRLAEAMDGEPGVEVLNDVVLNQVLLRFADDDAVTRAVVAGVQAEGEAWLGGTEWQGRAAVRVSVSNWRTTEEDVDRLAGALRRAHQAAVAPAAQTAP